MKSKFLKASAAMLAFALSTIPADAATLLGQTIKAGWRLPNENAPFAFGFSTPGNIFTVGNGVEGEAQLSAIRFLVDFSDRSATFTFLTNALFSTYAFNGIVFDQQNGGLFTDIDSITGIAANRVSNTGNRLAINFAGAKFNAGDKIVVNFASGVPEPASWGMLLIGVGGLGGAMRMRRDRAVLQHA
ncbi:PEP-CTERM sorting domain-containing protein [Sphingomonas sp. JC676]|uniref:PEP-CTERM sorting domain-containing protein n=1 Tax=Sphingomonas sp. JC676 TaxID=2768065 RepID=UPI0016583920|nr:PEP-CTERM sorting domain-containing protein [Sphingomonas sp. JC676]MBC9031722.1 PEP-CTERM sorting domain-containing protein [Sphingomonas sp. JC676]